MSPLRNRIVRYGLVALLAAVATARGEAQVPYQVLELGVTGLQGDLTWGGATSALGDRVFLSASNDAFSGNELWVTDGTVLGTKALPLRCLAPNCAVGAFLGAVHGVLLGASSGFDSPGPTLWRSDGTPQGTYPLPGPGPTPVLFNPSEDDQAYAFAGGRLFFVGDGPGRSPLWQTDGTLGGTQPVTLPTPLGGLVGQLTALGDKLYFVEGSELWTTDGTPQGTLQLRQANHGVGLLTAVGSKLIFAAGNSRTPEMWVSDGTDAGTHSIAPFARPDAMIDTAFFKAAGNHAFFVADDGEFGLQVWVTDGTQEGTRPLTKFTGGDPFGSDQPLLRDRTLAPSQIEEVNGRVVFVASDDGGAHFGVWSAAVSPAPAGPGQVALCAAGCVDRNEHLLKAGKRVVFQRIDLVGFSGTDGTPGGTVALPVPCDRCLLGPFSSLGDAIFFSVEHVGSDSFELWRSDGTAAGTGPFAAGGWNGQTLAALGKSVVFATNLYATDSLWISDGTPSGTRQLGGQPFEESFGPDHLVAQGDHLVFTDRQNTYGRVWETDGTPGQSTLLDDTGSFTVLGATDTTTYLVRNDADELWRSEVTSPAPTLVAEVPNIANGAPTAIFRGQLYIAAQDDAVWKSDGTSAGTGPAFVLPPGYVSPHELTPLGTGLYFVARGPQQGDDFLSNDGTSQGTIPLTQFGRTNTSTRPEITRAGANVFFVRSNMDQQRELWKTDGSPGGTVLVAKLDATELTEHQGALYFFASAGSSKALWRSDGTLQGTGVIALFPGCDFFCQMAPALLVSTGSLLFFVIDDGVHGSELWRSDGTAAGTAMVKDIYPGPVGSNPRDLRAAAGQVFFTADDGVHGAELWRSDGTDSGTRMVADLAPGPDSSSPSHLTVAGNRLFFIADDGVTDPQLWALPLTGPGCQPSATVLCVQGGRFAVSVEWLDFSGHAGVGQAVPLTADTGYFWFFGAANVEVIVKVLDGRLLNGNFWVFYGALSSVSYAITVTDTVTGLARRYENFAGNLASVADTSAFAGSGTSSGGAPAPAGNIPVSRREGRPAAAARAMPALPPARVVSREGVSSPPAANATGTCAADALHLCLSGDRFAVEASWTDFSGHSGSGTAVGLTGDTGYFWFFSPSNVEVVLKVLDGRAVNGKFWVFFGALSSVEYDLKVTDTATGAFKIYHNPPGQLASVADTSAF
jgi:ELWxxDGT repeat protein